MNSKEKQFKDLLKEILQFNGDKIELDFGVYRVFKRKEKEIRRFIDERVGHIVEEAVEKAFAGQKGADYEALNRTLSKEEE